MPLTIEELNKPWMFPDAPYEPPVVRPHQTEPVYTRGEIDDILKAVTRAGRKGEVSRAIGGTEPQLTLGRAYGALKESFKDLIRSQLTTAKGIAEWSEQDIKNWFENPENLKNLHEQYYSDVPFEQFEKAMKDKYLGLPSKIPRLEQRIRETAPSPEFAGKSSGYIEDFIRASIPMIGTMGAGALYGPMGATSFMGSHIVGSTYENLTKQGVPSDRALAAGMVNAAIQAPMEAIGVGGIFRAMKPQKLLMQKAKRMIEAFGTEWATEFFQAFPEMGVQIFAVQPDETKLERAKQFFDQIPEAAIQGAYEGTLTAPWALLGLAGGRSTAQSHEEYIDQVIEKATEDAVKATPEDRPKKTEQLLEAKYLKDRLVKAREIPTEPEPTELERRLAYERRTAAERLRATTAFAEEERARLQAETAGIAAAAYGTAAAEKIRQEVTKPTEEVPAPKPTEIVPKRPPEAKEEVKPERVPRTDIFFEPAFAERNIPKLETRIEDLHKSLYDSEEFAKSEFYDQTFPIPKTGGIISAKKTSKYRTDKGYKRKVDEAINTITSNIVDANKKRMILLGKPETGSFGVDYAVEKVKAGYTVDVARAWNMEAKSKYPYTSRLGNISVREGLQNSLDAVLEGIQTNEIKKGEIAIVITNDGQGYQITDNGIGMSDVDIATKFLALHGTGKDIQGRFGGFGIAKAVILGPSETATWNLLTRDNYFTHELAQKNEQVQTLETPIQGTQITVDTQDTIIDEVAKQYVETTEVPKNITLTFDGEAVENPFKRKKAQKTTAKINDQSTATIQYYPKAPKGYDKKYVIRLVDKQTQSKLTQAVIQIWKDGFPGAIIVDVDTTATPGSYEYPLTDSRMELKWSGREQVDKIIEKHTVDPLSAKRVGVESRWYGLSQRPEWKQTIEKVKQDKGYQALTDKINEIWEKTGQFFGHENPTPFTPLEQMNIKMDIGYKGYKGGTVFNAKHLAAYESVARLMAHSAGAKVTDFYGILPKTVDGGTVGAEYAQGAMGLNFINIDKTALKNPLEYAMYLRDLTAHELTHWYQGKHNEDYAASREEVARRTSGVFNHVLDIAEATLGKTAKDIRKVKVVEKPIKIEKVLKEYIDPKQLEFIFNEYERKGINDAERDLYYPEKQGRKDQLWLFQRGVADSDVRQSSEAGDVGVRGRIKFPTAQEVAPTRPRGVQPEPKAIASELGDIRFDGKTDMGYGWTITKGLGEKSSFLTKTPELAEVTAARDRIREGYEVEEKPEAVLSFADWMAKQPGSDRNQWILTRLNEQNIPLKPKSERGKIRFQNAAEKASKEFDELLRKRYQEYLAKEKPTKLAVSETLPTELQAKNLIRTAGLVKTWLKQAGLPKAAIDNITLELKPVLDLKGRDLAKTLEDWRKEGKTPKTLLGATTFDGFHATVELALNVQNLNELEKTTYHEAFHVATKWLLPESDYAAIQKYFKSDEGMADAFADYVQKGSQAIIKKPFIIRNLFRKIKSIFHRIASALKGAKIIAPEDIFGKIVRGKYPLKPEIVKRGTFLRVDDEVKQELKKPKHEKKRQKLWERYPDVDKWFAEKDWAEVKNSVESATLQNRLKSVMGKKRYDRDVRDIGKAIHIYIDLQRNPGHYNKYYGDFNSEQKRIADLARTIENNPEYKALADYLSAEYEKIWKESNKEGLINNHVDNFVNRVWKQPKGKRETDLYGKFITRTRHNKQRVLETILLGQHYGLELAVEDAFENLRIYKDELARVREDKRLIDKMTKAEWMDTGLPLLSKFQVNDNYEMINHPNFTYWGDKPVAYTKAGETSKLYGAKNIRIQRRFAVVAERAKRATKIFDTKDEAQAAIKQFKTDTGKNYTIEERNYIWERSQLWAPKDVARPLNKILGISKLKGIPSVDLLTKYNAFFKSTLLVTGLFHHQAFLRSYYLPTTGKTLKEWNPKYAWKNGLDSVMKLKPEIELLVRNGLTLGKMQDWEESLLRQEETIFGKVMAKTKPTQAIREKLEDLRQRQADFLFRNFGMGLKAQAALIKYREMLKKHPTMEPNERAAMVARLINDDFGGLHLGRLERRPTSQHIFRLLALAPDWGESNVRTMIKAFKAGSKEEAKMYRKFWASTITKGFTAVFLANLLLNMGDDDDYAEKFKRAWKEGNFRWMDIDITPIYKLLGGKTEERKYFSVVGHLRDPLKFIIHPIRSAHHKGSVLYRTIHEMMAGVDWRGQSFTTLPELMGVDDKGLYVTSIKGKHRLGDPKGGKFPGKLTAYTGKTGPIGIPQIPSYALAQLRGIMPIQVQQTWAMLSGEIEAFDGITKGLGFYTATTYSSERKSYLRFVEAYKKHRLAKDRQALSKLRREVQRYNKYQKTLEKPGIIPWKRIQDRALREIKAERIAERRAAKK